MMKNLLLSTSLLFVIGCGASETPPKIDAAVQTATSETTSDAMDIEAIGSVDMLVEGIVAPEAKVENLGGEFGWSEGPVWISEENRLLFTDVPGNIIWSYKDGEGLTEFLNPSANVNPIPDYLGSPGANGLIRLNAEEIVLPVHGDRALYALNLKTKEKRLLADRYEGKRFNSPNDVVLHASGILFFTDPPYGLKGQDESEVKEIPFNGVYALHPDGRIDLIDDSLTRPNGIVLSPDEGTLYVANSDPEDAKWVAYAVNAEGGVGDGLEILNATEDFAKGEVGNADGMAVDIDGRIYATGPGGVIVMSPTGERLGLIRTGRRIANVTFGGENGNILYMTSHDILARVPTLTKGHGL